MKYEYCSGAVIFTKKNEKIYYVIIKSREGIYGFPKGHLEGLESNYEAAKREVFEETGLKPNFIDGFEYDDSYMLPKKENTLKKIKYYLAYYENQTINYQKEELSGAYLMTYEEAIKCFQFDNLKGILDEAKKYIEGMK